MSIASIIHIVGTLLAMLFTDMSAKVCLNSSTSDKVNLDTTLESQQRHNRLSWMNHNEVYPVTVPGTAQTGNSINIFYIALSPQWTPLMEASRVNGVHFAIVL